MESTSQKAAETRTSESLVEKQGIPPQGFMGADFQAGGDAPAVDDFNDVSMMSVDGHMSVDFGSDVKDSA